MMAWECLAAEEQRGGAGYKGLNTERSLDALCDLYAKNRLIKNHLAVETHLLEIAQVSGSAPPVRGYDPASLRAALLEWG